MCKQHLLRAVAALAAAAALAGCSLFPDPNQTNHLDADSVAALEVPPDLSSPELNGQYVVPGTAGGKLSRNMLLPELDSTRMVRDGRVVWLELAAPPENLWPLLRNFLVQEGYPLARDEPLAGVLETQWVENRLEPGKSGVAAFFDSILSGIGDSGVRDSFVLRLERVPASGTRLFLRHRGLEEVVTSDNQVVDQQIETAWSSRPRDTELEARMLQRLLVYLGMEQQRASGLLSEAEAQRIVAQAFVDQDGEGNRFLFVGQTDDLVWPKLEVALEDIGFDIDDSERSAGRFEISLYGTFQQRAEKKGFFSGLFGGDNELVEYLVRLGPIASGSRVTVEDRNGERLPTEEEQALLNALKGEFR
jgi:outer membrane protein assembly factor BamC